MSDQLEKNRGLVVDYHHQPPPPPPPPPQYGTFQGVANYPPPRPPHPLPSYSQHPPVIGFPPPGLSRPAAPRYYAYGYQTVQGYAVAEGLPVRERRLPCCGIGLGWFLFIIGFFLAAVPWYAGLFLLLCTWIDPREKPGYIACTIAAILATVALVFGVTKGADD